MDDERLKGNKKFGKDYFDELLERIREMRVSDEGRYAVVYGRLGQSRGNRRTIFGKIEGVPKKSKRGQVAFRNVVLTLLERGGSARSFHVDGTTIGTLIPIIRINISRESALHTD